MTYPLISAMELNKNPEFSVLSRFRAQVLKEPQQVAVVHTNSPKGGPNEKFTYTQVDRSSEAIFASLHEYLHKTARDHQILIAIALPRGFAEVVALVAVLKARAVFVPIDINLSAPLQIQLVEDSGVCGIVTNSDNYQKLSGHIEFSSVSTIGERNLTNPFPTRGTYMKTGSPDDALFSSLNRTAKNKAHAPNTFEDGIKILWLSNIVQRCPRKFPYHDVDETGTVIEIHSGEKECASGQDLCSEYWNASSDLSSACCEQLAEQTSKTGVVERSHKQTQGVKTSCAMASESSDGQLRTSTENGRCMCCDSSHKPAAQIMYIMYTSGSTGKPKGVCGTEAGTLNRLVWYWEKFPFEPGERVARKTPLVFVDAIAEIFGALLAGIPLVIIEEDVLRSPPRLLKELEEGRVTRLTAIPSLIGVLLRAQASGKQVSANSSGSLSRLKLWISSGEPLSSSLIAWFCREMPLATLVNLYGSTEVAGDATFAIIARAGQVMYKSLPWSSGGARLFPNEAVPIGEPLPNVVLFVVDDRGEVINKSSDRPGELLIGGVQTFPGYWSNREVSDAASGEQSGLVMMPTLYSGGKLYRTGDVVRYGDAPEMQKRECGPLKAALPYAGCPKERKKRVLFYLGRKDLQVKIRGIRVEIEGVEAAFRNIVARLTEQHPDAVEVELSMCTVRRQLYSSLEPWAGSGTEMHSQSSASDQHSHTIPGKSGLYADEVRVALQGADDFVESGKHGLNSRKSRSKVHGSACTQDSTFSMKSSPVSDKGRALECTTAVVKYPDCKGGYLQKAFTTEVKPSGKNSRTISALDEGNQSHLTNEFFSAISQSLKSHEQKEHSVSASIRGQEEQGASPKYPVGSVCKGLSGLDPSAEATTLLVLVLACLEGGIVETMRSISELDDENLVSPRGTTLESSAGTGGHVVSQEHSQARMINLRALSELLLTEARTCLPYAWVPSLVFTVPSLPKTFSTGKIDRRKLGVVAQALYDDLRGTEHATELRTADLSRSSRLSIPNERVLAISKCINDGEIRPTRMTSTTKQRQSLEVDSREGVVVSKTSCRTSCRENTEDTLCATRNILESLVGEVLGPKISAKMWTGGCSFFDLGGDSLLAAEIIHKIYKDLSVVLDLNDLHMPICELSEYLSSKCVPLAKMEDVRRRTSGNLQPGYTKRKRVRSPNSTAGNIFQHSNFEVIGRGMLPALRSFKFRHSSELAQTNMKWMVDTQIAWRVDLGKCVDATATILVNKKDPAASRAFIGSHAGQLVCVCVADGNVFWRKALPERIEASVAVSPWSKKLYFGCYGGALYCLSTEDGQTKWTVLLPADVKSTVVFDKPPSCSEERYIYCGCYDKSLYRIKAADGQILDRVILDGSIYSTPATGTVNDERRLFVATTAGELVSLSIKGDRSLGERGQEEGGSNRGSGLKIKLIGESIAHSSLARGKSPTTEHNFEGAGTREAPDPDAKWSLNFPGPIFSSICKGHDHNVLIFGCADGVVYGVSVDGRLLWCVDTGKPIFSSAFPFTLRGKDEELEVVVIGSHDGKLRAISVKDGSLLWESAHLNSPIFSTPFVFCLQSVVAGSSAARTGGLNCAVTPQCWQAPIEAEVFSKAQYSQRPHLATLSDGVGKGPAVVAVCSTAGIITLLDGENGQKVGGIQLPGEVFSSPIVTGDKLVVGCRDNFVYGLSLRLEADR